MATKVKARKNGGATIKLDATTAKALKAVVGITCGDTLYDLYLGLNTLYPHDTYKALSGGKRCVVSIVPEE